MSSPLTYKLVLEYDGSRFVGWQFQPRRRTVQGVLEDALRRLFRKKIKTVGASRTDAGVHAAGQVASFRAPFLFRGNLAAALNSHLSSDVAVLQAEKAPDAFHARRSAVGKVYEYRLVNRPVRPALEFGRAGWCSRPLDLGAMRRESARLLQKNDFSAFAGPSSRRRSPHCRLKFIRLLRQRDIIVFQMSADRFLHRMARRLAGHLVQAGQDPKKNPIPKTLEPQGLTLIKVLY